MNFAVVLPADRSPAFAESCVACGAAAPGTCATLPAGSATPRMKVPACAGCARRIERGGGWPQGLLIGGAVLGTLWFAAVFVLAGAFCISLAGAVLGVFGPVLWLSLRRTKPPLATALASGRVSYLFADRRPAEAFAAANGTTVGPADQSAAAASSASR